MKVTRIPIAMLHHVSNRSDWESLKPFVVCEETFLRFLNAIQAAGKHPTTFEEICQGNAPSNPIIITVDDCGKHLFDFVIPELTRRKMKAVFFSPTAHLGDCNSWDVAEGRSKVELMDSRDLKALSQLGMEIGGHSHHHVHLGRMEHEAVLNELVESRAIIQNITGKAPVSMAYPFGSIPENAEEIMAQAGYTYACGIFCPKAAEFSLRRFIVHDGDSAASIRFKLSGAHAVYRAWTDSHKPESAFR